MDIKPNKIQNYCQLHDQNQIILISLNANQENVLKCSECLLEQGLNSSELISIDSILKYNGKKIPKNWILSQDNEILQAFNQYNNDIDSFPKTLDQIAKEYKHINSEMQYTFDNLQSLFFKKIEEQKQTKINFFKQFNDLSQLKNLQEILGQQDNYKMSELNKMIKQIIKNSKDTSLQTSNKLKLILKQEKNFNIESTQKSILHFQKDLTSFLKEQIKQLQNNNKIFQENEFSSNQINQPQVNHNNNNITGNQKNIEEILKLISNKSNGLKDEFINELKKCLNSAQDQLSKLNINNIYKDNQIYPLKFNQLDESQFKEIITFTTNPNNYSIVDNKIINNMKNLNNSNNNNQRDQTQFQDLFKFQQTNYQQSKQLDIKKQNNSYIINNTRRTHQGQIITNKPLINDKEYLFRISFSSTFINNYLYFGLIDSENINKQSIVEKKLGFSFSTLLQTKNQINILSGQEFYQRQNENIELEIRINIQKCQMLILSYPNQNTIYTCQLNIPNQQFYYHFGIGFYSEKQFEIDIFHQEIIN